MTQKKCTMIVDGAFRMFFVHAAIKKGSDNEPFLQ